MKLIKKTDRRKDPDRSFLQTLIDNIPNPIFYKDAGGKYLGCNKAYESLIGLTREHLTGKSVFDIAPPHLAEIYHKADEELFRKQGVQVYESAVKYADGVQHDVIFYKATFPAMDGSLGGLVGTVLEISERKQMETELRESRQYLSDIIQFFPDATLVIDLAGKVVAWNRAMEEMSKVPAEEMLGKGNHEYAIPFYGERRPILIDLVMQPEEENEEKYAHIERRSNMLFGEAYMQNAQGEELFLQGVAAVLHNSRGEIIGAIESIRDITERKRIEEEVGRLNVELEQRVAERTRELLDAQEELVRKEKLAILGQLSGSVGHELRNPLGVMSNAVYFLKIVHADGDDTTKEYLDIIKHEIDNSQRIITDLLDFARTRPPQRMMVTPEELVRQSLELCGIPDNVAVTVDIPEAMPGLNADPPQMGQVLMNFITNAIQAMPNGGALLIAARFVQGSRFKVHGSEKNNVEHGTLNIEPDADFIEISVEDTGEGISPENMKKLFQPLFTTKTRGIGLGLVVCKNLVEANGGMIEVKSEPGKATTFTVVLPVESPNTVDVKQSDSGEV